VRGRVRVRVCVSVQGSVTRPEGAFRVDVAHFALASIEPVDGELRGVGFQSAAHPQADTRRVRHTPQEEEGRVEWSPSVKNGRVEGRAHHGRDAKRVAKLSLASAELAVELGDAPGFDATPQELVDVLDTGCDALDALTRYEALRSGSASPSRAASATRKRVQHGG